MVQEIQESDYEVKNKITEGDNEKQDTRSARKGFRRTDAGGFLRCDLDGNEHRKHSLVECQDFWNQPSGMKRSLLRTKACFGPRGKCINGCSKKPPKEMLCQSCEMDNAKFVPAAVMCKVEEHRNRADGKAVLGAMQQFLGRFQGQHYVVTKVLDQAVSEQ